MKNLFKTAVLVSVCFLLYYANAFADVPNTVSLQGRLTTNTGVPITGTKDFTFEIYSSETATNPIKTFSNQSIYVSNGMYSAVLDLSSLTNEQLNNSLYVQIKIGNSDIGNRIPLTASPYALTVKNGAITEDKISSNAVTSDKIANNAVNSSKIQDGSIAESDLNATIKGRLNKGISVENGSAGNNQYIRAIAIDSTDDHKIKVTTAALPSISGSSLTTVSSPQQDVTLSGTIGQAEATIRDGAVTTAKINNGAVTSDKIADSAVTTTKINNVAVTTAKINNGAVISDKIADSAVTTGKIADSAVTKAKINATGNSGYLKLNGNVMSWENISITGVPSVSGTGAKTYLSHNGSIPSWKSFGDGLTEDTNGLKVTNPLPQAFPQLSSTNTNKVLTYSGGNLIWAALANDSNQDVSVSGNINAVKASINNNAVTTDKIQDGAVTTSKINIDADLNLNSKNLLNVNNINVATINGSPADLAEIYPSAEILNPGDVVVISETRDEYIEKSRQANDTKVAGVVSTKPGIVLNAEAKGYQLALVGKVPVNVTNEGGSIKRGDLLVTSSTGGYAMKAPENPKPGTIIGKALENYTGSRGKILALVNLQ